MSTPATTPYLWRREPDGTLSVTAVRFIAVGECEEAAEDAGERARSGPAPIGDLIHRYEAGENQSELARAYGVSSVAIRKRLLKAGVRLRGREETNTRHGGYANGGRPSRAGQPGKPRPVRVATAAEIRERERAVPEWMRPAPPSAAPAWPAADDALLLDMRRAGEAWGPIARLLGKGADECRDRWFALTREERQG